MCALVMREAAALEAPAQAAGIRLHVDRCALTHAECSIFVCDPVQVGQGPGRLGDTLLSPGTRRSRLGHR